MKVNTDDVKRVRDPFDRVLVADTEMEQCRRALSELKEIRVAALRELVRAIGGAAAADKLHIRRPSLYRAIRSGKTTEEIEEEERGTTP